MKKSNHSRSESNSRSAPRKAASRPRSSRSKAAPLNEEWLQNFFSEMLAVERGGAQLYEKALEELDHEELRSKLEQYHEQTQRHVELCEEMLNAAGGDEDNMAPAAEAAEHKAQGLLSAEVPEELMDINNLENLVLAETKDHWNWEMLASVMDQIEDRELKKIVSRAVREVRKQENDHVTWTQKMLTRIATEAAHQMPEMEEEEEEQEEGEGEESRD
jgi:rubrerythrin